MATKKTTVPYHNNPFTIGLEGLKLFFKNAKNVAIYAIILAGLAFLFNTILNISDMLSYSSMTPEQMTAQDDRNQAQFERELNAFFAQDIGSIAIAGVVIASAIFLFIVISLLLYGVLEYTGARIAKNEKVGLKTAFKEVGGELAGYVWLHVLITVKVLLWSLLFIVPGIIMAIRYSLAGTVFFAEGKRGNAAVKRSLELTKGAWFTTFSGFAFWNILTLGMAAEVVMPGCAAVLYRQLRETTDSGTEKPAAHWLSLVTLPAIVLLTLALLLVLTIVAIAASMLA